MSGATPNQSAKALIEAPRLIPSCSSADAAAVKGDWDGLLTDPGETPGGQVRFLDPMCRQTAQGTPQSRAVRCGVCGTVVTLGGYSNPEIAQTTAILIASDR